MDAVRRRTAEARNARNAMAAYRWGGRRVHRAVPLKKEVLQGQATILACPALKPPPSGSTSSEAYPPLSLAPFCPPTPLRWHLLRLYFRFEGHRRQGLRKAWHDTKTGLVTLADQQARMAEQVAWQLMNEAVQV